MKPRQTPERALAEAVRQACLEAARASFEAASLSGLCREGAVEAALDAIRALDLEKVLPAPAAGGKKL
jgi:hypothetical protein